MLENNDLENKALETNKITKIFNIFFVAVCLLIGRLLYISTGKYSGVPFYVVCLYFVIYFDVLFIVWSLITKKKYIAKIHNVAIFIALFFSAIIFYIS